MTEKIHYFQTNAAIFCSRIDGSVSTRCWSVCVAFLMCKRAQYYNKKILTLMTGPADITLCPPTALGGEICVGVTHARSI